MDMNTGGFRSASLVLTSLVLTVTAGCAQMPSQSGSGDTSAGSGSSAGSCNPVVGGALGALAGAMFGKGKGHLAGAAIGAGIGAFACIAYNYHVRKVRDAKAVEQEYARQRGGLPASNTVADYRSELTPSNTVRSGTSAQMQSRVTVISGTHDATPQLKEELTLYSPEGKVLSTVSKPATAVDGTGEYETNFNFNLPKGIEEGRYTMRSTLFMDGKQVRTNEVPMLVVS
ncbi:glycine zipper domain-containing protein [Dyella lutea]|uniref:Glycine zipper domain-containing protein n=1 Tax=Dyella lutea TaxID=2950441 RepID=A0ABT1FB58_9GAMM|nr:glycine zipper domain-containing protein [Dyella lutea]MCP1374589.1 glycine zipper domain-containing protein [Dyella lutea]